MKHLSRLACGLLAVLLATLPLCALAEAPGPIPGMIDEKAEIIVAGETDLPGHFFLSFPFSRNLICSFRHIHSILCFDRSASENQIKWTLSGVADEFDLTPIQKCSVQHTAFVDGNFITAFDNGNRNGTSRAVGYCVDTEAKKLKAFRAYTLGGKYSEACGSAQHLNDEVYVIGWGATMGDPEAMSVVDSATSETLMSVSLKNPVNSTYRRLYFEPVQNDSPDDYLASAREAAGELRASLQNDLLTQADMNLKSEELREIWEDVLAGILDEAKWVLPEAEWNALSEAQSAWMASAQTAIEAAGKDFEGGSMHALAVNMEAANLAEARVYEIYEMLK